MSEQSSSGTLFVVQRLSWRVGLGVFFHDDKDGGLPVRAFADPEQAERLRAELESEARRELPPFRFIGGELECMTGMKELEFFKHLATLGIPGPAQPLGEEIGDNPAWQNWWDEVAGELDDRQRLALWDLLWREPVFYRVVEGEED
jgi:hypothetical protein